MTNLTNRLTYRSNKSGCKAFCIFNYTPCQNCAKAPRVGCYENTRFAYMTSWGRLWNELIAVIGSVGPKQAEVFQQIVVFIHRPSLKLMFSCLLRTDKHQNVWNMAELAVLSRIFEKVYLIFSSGKRNQWKWTLQTDYTYYFCKREPFPVRLLYCWNRSNRCHIVLDYTMNSIS